MKCYILIAVKSTSQKVSKLQGDKHVFETNRTFSNDASMFYVFFFIFPYFIFDSSRGDRFHEIGIYNN